MSSKKTLEIRLKDCTEQTNISVEQIQAYRANENIISEVALNFICRYIERVDCNDLQRLCGVCENSANIIQEVNLLAKKELQKRRLQESLKGVEERGLIKKNKPAWYSDRRRSF